MKGFFNGQSYRTFSLFSAYMIKAMALQNLLITINNPLAAISQRQIKIEQKQLVHNC